MIKKKERDQNQAPALSSIAAFIFYLSVPKKFSLKKVLLTSDENGYF